MENSKENRKAINQQNPNDPTPDPSIRQEFPGADNSKQKIEGGKRNVNNQDTGAAVDKKVLPHNDTPADDGELEPSDPQTH